MRTPEQIDAARDVVCRHLADRRLTVLERATLSGMSVVLQWVAGTDSRTLQDLIDGRPTAWQGRPPVA